MGARKKAEAPVSGSDRGVAYQVLYFARAALRMLSGADPHVRSVTIEEPGAWPVDDVVIEFESGHVIGGTVFSAEYIQVKSGGTAADVLASSDLIDKKKTAWLATKGGTPFLPRLAARWTEFLHQKIVPCLTLVTTRAWSPGDPVAGRASADATISAAIFNDHRAAAILGQWQAASAFEDDLFRDFVSSIRIVANAPTIEGLRGDIASELRTLQIGDALDVPRIENAARNVFWSTHRTLDRKTLLLHLQATGFPAPKLPLRLRSIVNAEQTPLHALLTSRSATPVDVGAVWGMQSGAFAGVIAGTGAEAVASRLAQAQRVLRLASRQSPVAVPPREWRVMDTFAGRVDPSDVDDILRGQFHGAPCGVVIDVADGRPETFESICDIAVSRLRGGTDAVVAALPGDLAPGVKELLRLLERSGVRAEVLRLGEPAAVDSIWAAAASDVSLDRWFDGHDFGDGSELARSCRNPAPEGRGSVIDIVLGLLRLARRHPERRDAVQRVLTLLDPLLGEDIRDLVTLWRDGITGTTRPDLDALLIRADMIREVRVDDPGAHPLLLQAQLPSRERLIDLLTEPPRVRAVIGLCTTDEWRAIGNDELEIEHIVDQRRGRPLPSLGSSIVT